MNPNWTRQFGKRRLAFSLRIGRWKYSNGVRTADGSKPNLVLPYLPTEKLAPNLANRPLLGAANEAQRIPRSPLPWGAGGHPPKKKPATCAGSDLLTVDAVFGEPVSGANSLHQGIYQGIFRGIA